MKNIQGLETKCTSHGSEKLKKILLLMFVTTLTYLSGRFEYIKWPFGHVTTNFYNYKG